MADWGGIRVSASACRASLCCARLTCDNQGVLGRQGLQGSLQAGLAGRLHALAGLQHHSVHVKVEG